MGTQLIDPEALIETLVAVGPTGSLVVLGKVPLGMELRAPSVRERRKASYFRQWGLQLCEERQDCRGV